ncbi:MAG: D-2-hydroxyacid dehydrogenase [Clostridia bacterium]
MDILVTIPVTDAQHDKLASLTGDDNMRFILPKDLTEKDVKGKEIIIGNIPISMIPKADSLKWLQLNMSGYEGYPKAMGDRPVTNTRGAFGLAISEHMIGMLLMLKKRLHQYRDNQLNSLWRDEGNVTSLEDAVVLIVGLGNIGGDFARKVKAFSSYTIGIRRNLADKPDYIDEIHPLSDLDTLIPRADVIALSIPNSNETYKLMNRKRIFNMKPGSILINVGRGAAVDTDALTDAVYAGRIMAALDVTDPEPLPADHPLWKAKNALITPHISGFFHLPQTLDRIVDIACENLVRYKNGEMLKNIVK